MGVPNRQVLSSAGLGGAGLCASGMSRLSCSFDLKLVLIRVVESDAVHANSICDILSFGYTKHMDACTRPRRCEVVGRWKGSVWRFRQCL